MFWSLPECETISDINQSPTYVEIESAIKPFNTERAPGLEDLLVELLKEKVKILRFGFFV